MGNDRHAAIGGVDTLVAKMVPGDPVSGHRPSIDVLFESVSHRVGPAAVGILLTGMGQDGARGLLELRKAGAVTFAQDEKSSVVYGMPRVAWEIGAVQRQLPLERIAGAILAHCGALQAG